MALVNKIALITGGANGIGLATAKVFLEERIKVITILDLQETLEVKDLRKNYPDAVLNYLPVDVTSEEQVRDAFKKTMEKFKGLDIVVHAAGIMNDNNWRKEMQVNMNGSVIVNLVALEVMGKDRGGNGGTILNLSSESAFVVHSIVPLYASTKAAILTMTRCFGSELFFANTGVKVMAICPGGTRTNMATETFSNQDVLLKNFAFVKKAVAGVSHAITHQSPESVGKCMVKAIIDGENGSVWWSRDDLPGQKMQLTATPVEL